MPISTVKQVSGPLQPRKIYSERLAFFSWRMRFVKRNIGWQGASLKLLVACVILILTTLCRVEAQTLQARISVISTAPARIRIDAEFPHARNALSFRNTYGNVLGLGERIEMLEAIKAGGEIVAAKKLAPGEFQTSGEFTHFNYEVNVTEPARPAQMASVSWLNSEQGLLMLADLLPPAAKGSAEYSSAQIRLDVPIGWTIGSNIMRQGSEFLADNPEHAIFLLGPALHEKSRQVGATKLSIISSGPWPFSDEGATKIAAKLIDEYSQLTGFALRGKAVVLLLPFPGTAGPESWSAETRGNVVVLLLGRNAGGKRVLSRLGIVLSHELFHFWVPNALKLDGDYDWFFEGFTLYQALRMALRLHLISFTDYLETIARVYDAYLIAADRDRISLLEASERRWTTSSALVYEKGMLVAFVYDLSLRRLTNCRAALDDLYRQLFRMSVTGHGSANEIIIKLLSQPNGLESFAKDYVEGARKIDLDPIVSPFGIQVQSVVPGVTKLVTSRNPDKTQRSLLGCIGYRK